AASTHVYAASGAYLATLVATDDEGASATAQLPLTVAMPPTAGFSDQAVSGEPLDIRFTDRSTGDVTSWSWDFGDGTTSSEQDPQHLFTAEADYTVHLTVGGPAGTDDVTSVVHVGASANSSGGGGGCSVAPVDGGPTRSDPALAMLVA